MPSGFKTFSVGDTVYKYNSLNPAEAIYFGARVVQAFGPSLASLGVGVVEEKSSNQSNEAILMAFQSALSSLNAKLVTELINEALAKCYTPKNESLADEATFNLWFTEHKDHLFAVGPLALFYLTKDFFPKMPATLKARLQMLLAEASMSQSRKDGK